MNHEIRWNQNFSYGFDHGAGHPLRFLDDAKAPNCRKNNGFKDIGNYSEWPKVAGAVIKAFLTSNIRQKGASWTGITFFLRGPCRNRPFVDIADLIRSSRVAGLCYDTPHVRVVIGTVIFPD